jgi:hypothetical protein
MITGIALSDSSCPWPIPVLLEIVVESLERCEDRPQCSNSSDTFFTTAGSALKTRRGLALENLALRQQLALPERERQRLHLTDRDRLFWVWLSRIWADSHPRDTPEMPGTLSEMPGTFIETVSRQQVATHGGAPQG